MEHIDVAVVGAGVTGLAAAHARPGKRGYSVCVLEQHPRPASTSTHNSGVIHAGLYYPAGPQGAAVHRGARACSTSSALRTGSHPRCGKLVVARRRAEMPQLETLHASRPEQWRRRPDDGRPRVHREARTRNVTRPSPHLVSGNRNRGRRGARRGRSTRRASPTMRFFFQGTTLLRRRQRPETASRCERSARRSSRPTVVNAAGLYADDVSQMLGGE